MEIYVNTRLLRNSNLENVIELSHHPDLTLDVLKAKPNLAWGFHFLDMHPNFTFEWVKAFPDRFWEWNRLSTKVDIDTLGNNPDMGWNWRLVTSVMEPSDMMKYPELPWDFSMFFIRNVTEDHIPFLEKFQHVIPDWKWAHLAKNTRWPVFKKNLHLPWIWFIADVKIHSIEFEKDDVEIIREYELLCNWVKLSMCIHVDIIHANPDLPWSLDFLQWNRTTWNTRIKPFEECILEWHSANVIKRQWKRSITDPSFKMCRDRIYREFKELATECNRNSMFHKLRDDAIIPSKATPNSIGLDLYSADSYVIFPGQRVVVSTGVKADLPDGVYGRIAARSGLAVKHGIDVGGGVIDPGDDSEIRVVLFNHDERRPFVIRPGYRIALLILEKALAPPDA